MGIFIKEDAKKISKHTPLLLHDSALAFLTTARIYARLHDVFI